MDYKECPSCGQNMEQGYIIAPGGMHWNQTIPTGMIHLMRESRGVPYGVRFTRPSVGESICPSSDPRINWVRIKFPYLESFRCRTCNLFIYSCRAEDEEFLSSNKETPKGKVLKCPSCNAAYFYDDKTISEGILICQNCLYEFEAVT